MIRKFIVYPGQRTVKAASESTAPKTKKHELDEADRSVIADIEAYGVRAAVKYIGRSSRGFAVSTGEPILYIYVPEELYSKDLVAEFKEIMKAHRWLPILERHGRTRDGDIILRGRERC